MLAHKSMFTLCDVNCSFRTEVVYNSCSFVCVCHLVKVHNILSKPAFFLLVSFFYSDKVAQDFFSAICVGVKRI
jgi:hypothetical protein